MSPCPHGLFCVAENATQFFSGDRIRFPSLILHLAHSCGNFSGPFRIYGDLSIAGMRRWIIFASGRLPIAFVGRLSSAEIGFEGNLSSLVGFEGRLSSAGGKLSSAGGKLSSAAWGDLSEWHHERCGHGFMNIVSGGIVEALPNGHGCGLNGAQS